MKLTILAFICMGIIYVSSEDPSCEEDITYAEGCYDDPYYAKIECPTGETDCSCSTGSGFDDACNDVIPGPVADMDKQTCKDKCKALAGCVFYRWELYSDTKCSLMNKDQCKSYEPCSGEHCSSGQVACESAINPDPVGTNCNSGAEFIAGNIHWKCINPFDEHQDRIDIYQKDEGGNPSILPGTICYTDRKCKEFDTQEEDKKEGPDYLYHTLVVQCGVEESGKWDKYAQSTNDLPAGTITGDQTLTDPSCSLTLDDLQLNKAVLTESGVSFICADGDNLDWTGDDVLVKNPNTCALLCNFHQTMTIEPKFNEDEGTSEWWMYPIGDPLGQMAEKEKVFCWTYPPNL